MSGFLTPGPNTDVATPYTCTVCTSTLLCKPQHINGHPICAPCLRRLFELSLSTPASFPPRWGTITLNHHDFADALDSDLLARLDERWREHNCPVNERVYCRQQWPPGRSTECGAFLGRRSETEMLCRRCRRCGLYSCLRCGQRFSYGQVHESTGLQGRVRHICDDCSSEREVERAERDAAFIGLDRGKDYQDCPDCGRRMELADGCNHITCPCGASFCYVCGRTAREMSEHWNRRGGGCPRYGLPGPDALFAEDLELGFEDAEDAERVVEGIFMDDGDVVDERRLAAPRWFADHGLMDQAWQIERGHMAERDRHHFGELERRTQGRLPGLDERRNAVDQGRPRTQHRHHRRSITEQSPPWRAVYPESWRSGARRESSEAEPSNHAVDGAERALPDDEVQDVRYYYRPENREARGTRGLRNVGSSHTGQGQRFRRAHTSRPERGRPLRRVTNTSGRRSRSSPPSIPPGVSVSRHGSPGRRNRRSTSKESQWRHHDDYDINDDDAHSSSSTSSGWSAAYGPGRELPHSERVRPRRGLVRTTSRFLWEFCKEVGDAVLSAPPQR